MHLSEDYYGFFVTVTFTKELNRFAEVAAPTAVAYPKVSIYPE